MSSEPIIVLEDVSIGYNHTGFLESINLRIKRDEFWGILGPNGGGKTTLLKTILGLIPKVSGSLSYTDNLVFGYVPQRENFDKIYPISVSELLMMGRYSRIKVGRNPKKEDREFIGYFLEKLEISHLERQTFRSLSGGEKQRALIARAIAGKPDILVLDEPTASVDLKGGTGVMELIENIRTEDKITVLMVSHFINTVSRFSDHVIAVDKDKGIFRSGLKEEVLRREIIDEIFD
ncbi:MAG: metal ABC transporter ATP-binding protein [Thermodesulfobacteriota bacterium]